jgi:hypothetical protein
MIITTKTDLIVVMLQTLVLYDLMRIFVSILLQLIGQSLRRKEDADK